MTEGSSGTTLGLVLKNNTRELERLTEALDNFADRHELPGDTRFELQLCIEELVLNIINHGFDDGAEHDIRVDLEIQGEARVITVHLLDDGRKFDPLSDAPEPDIEAELEERAVGGLGIHFVRQFMDDARYCRENGQNHLILTKNVGT